LLLFNPKGVFVKKKTYCGEAMPQDVKRKDSLEENK
jgi:hypothetical protein